MCVYLYMNMYVCIYMYVEIYTHIYMCICFYKITGMWFEIIVLFSWKYPILTPIKFLC